MDVNYVNSQACYLAGSRVKGHDGKLLLMVMIAFVWCYNIGELVHRKIRPIRILKHGRKEKSIIRYGLDIVADYLQRGINEFKIPIFDLFGITNQIFT
ncbi:MAG: hypothetical protein IKO59_09095 [Bacteroidales bacterium]|nr:hypothetical protein [Bacteroidales bacterium]